MHSVRSFNLVVILRFCDVFAFYSFSFLSFRRGLCDDVRDRDPCRCSVEEEVGCDGWRHHAVRATYVLAGDEYTWSGTHGSKLTKPAPRSRRPGPIYTRHSPRSTHLSRQYSWRTSVNIQKTLPGLLPEPPQYYPLCAYKSPSAGFP